MGNVRFGEKQQLLRSLILKIGGRKFVNNVNCCGNGIRLV